MENILLTYRLSPWILLSAQPFAFWKWQKWSTLFFCAYIPLMAWVMFTDDAFRQPRSIEQITFAFLFAYVAVLLLLFSVLKIYSARRLGKELGECSLDMREDGILFTTARDRIRHAWTNVRKIRAIPARRKENAWIAILLDSSPQETGFWPGLGPVIPVPFSAFPGDAERQAFVALIEAKIRSASKDG